MTPAAPCQPSLRQFSLDEQAELAEMLDHLMQTNRVVQNFGTLVIDRLSGIREGQAIREDLLGELKNYYLDFIRYAQDQDQLAVSRPQRQF